MTTRRAGAALIGILVVAMLLPSVALTAAPSVTPAAAAASVTLWTSASVVTWGAGIVLTVHFGTNGGGKTFELQGTRDGLSWTTIITPTTDASGHFAMSYRPPTDLFRRVVFAGTPNLSAPTSSTVRTVVRQIAFMRPTNSGHSRTIPRNTSITFTTTVRPARPELAPAKVSFWFYRHSGGSWVLAAKRDVLADAVGLARTTFKFTSSGQWYVHAAANPTPYNANSVMSPVERHSVN